jgi:hypothetical protein
MRFRHSEQTLPFPSVEATIAPRLGDEEPLDRLAALPERRRVHVVLVDRPSEEGAEPSQTSADGRDAPAPGDEGVAFDVGDVSDRGSRWTFRKASTSCRVTCVAGSKPNRMRAPSGRSISVCITNSQRSRSFGDNRSPVFALMCSLKYVCPSCSIVNVAVRSVEDAENGASGERRNVPALIALRMSVAICSASVLLATCRPSSASRLNR